MGWGDCGQRKEHNGAFEQRGEGVLIAIVVGRSRSSGGGVVVGIVGVLFLGAGLACFPGGDGEAVRQSGLAACACACACACPFRYGRCRPIKEGHHIQCRRKDARLHNLQLHEARVRRALGFIDFSQRRTKFPPDAVQFSGGEVVVLEEEQQRR